MNALEGALVTLATVAPMITLVILVIEVPVGAHVELPATTLVVVPVDTLF